MTTSKKSMLLFTFAALLSVAVLSGTSVAQSYNAAGDFSTGSNPNGAWSYGWSATLGSAFNLDSISTNGYTGTGLSGWLSGLNPGDGIPYVLHNGTANPIVLAGSTTYQPGQLAEHPGPSNQYCVVRWTAPFSGTFSINATFSGLDSHGDTTDVHILHDGVSIFDSNVNGTPAPQSFSGLQGVLAGDTIDFAVGFGSNGNYNNDTTGLSATIVPEPGTLALVAMGLASLFSVRFLKRQ